MNENLSILEQKVLELRQEKGYTIEQTLSELNINQKKYKIIVDKLKELNLYDEEKIKKAKQNKKMREYRNTNKNKVKLSKEEEEYRQKCIDFMCKKYFDYNRTKVFNPVLVTKIQQLKNICSYKVIFNTMRFQEQNLNYANSKTFSSEFQKIGYMMTIIKNNLKEVWKKIDMQDKIQARIKEEGSTRIVNELNRKIVTKPTKRIDMSDLLDD